MSMRVPKVHVADMLLFLQPSDIASYADRYLMLSYVYACLVIYSYSVYLWLAVQ